MTEIRNIYEYDDIMSKHEHNKDDVYTICQVTVHVEPGLPKPYCSRKPYLVCETIQ